MIAAVHPGLWQPAVLAKLGATANHPSGGRFAVNVVSGWFKDEFTHLGEPWLEHDERYRRSAEFLQVLRRTWTEDDVDFRGDFYRIHDFTLKPKPLNTADRPNPELFQGGNSAAARRNGGYYADWYFSNGKDFDGVTEQVVEVRDHARQAGQEVRFGLNGFIIARDTLREIIENARADRGTCCGVPQTRGRSDPRRLPAFPGRDRVSRLAGAAVGARNRGVRTGFARRTRARVGLTRVFGGAIVTH